MTGPLRGCLKINYHERSTEPEWIDFPGRLSSQENARVLRELRLVNRWLGGNRCVLKALAELLDNPQFGAGTRKRSLTLVDIGSGAADLPALILRRASWRGLSLRAVALDFNFASCRFAREENFANSSLYCVQGDACRLPIRPEACDVIFCSAFLHHFGDEEAVSLLREFRLAAGRAVVINDLQRHPVAYWGIRILTRLFSRSEAVKNDGPVSVLKGFRRRELESLLRRAGFEKVSIRWQWAFRYTVIALK